MTERVRRSMARIAAVALAVAWLPAAGGHAATSQPCGENAGWSTPGGGSEDGGVGGTGVRGGDEDGGVGGTGVRGGDEDGGVGGTGVRAERGEPDGGVGGTGIQAAHRLGLFGRITGFGSICVNGEEIAVDAEAVVRVDGEPVASDALAIGQVVIVEAERGHAQLQAVRITVEYALSGPITAVDVGQRRLEVMGRPVAVGGAPSNVPLRELRVGEYLRVSGLAAANGRVIASRLDRVPPRPVVTATGPLQRIDDRFSIAGLAVAGEGTRAVHPAVAYASATGVWNPASGTIEDASLTPVLDRFAGIGRVSLEGYLHERSDGAWAIAGFTVRAGAARLPELPSDRLVRVTAHVREAGELAADRVEWLDAPWRDRDTHGRGRDRDRDVEPPERGRDLDHSGESDDLDRSDDYDREFDDYDSEGADYEAPDFGDETPDFEAPEAPEYEAPETPDYETPELPEYEAPELPDVESPEVPEFEGPEL